MASGRGRNMCGTVVGTGAALNVRTVGFRPKIVQIFNVTGDAMAFWSETMPDASAMKTIAAGTTAQITTLGITPLSNGFTFGADTDLNVAGEVVHWVAWE